MDDKKDTCFFWAFIFLVVAFFIAFNSWANIKIEHEKTIQKAIECGYQPLCIGGDYWNKED